jgi:hypothetical protein
MDEIHGDFQKKKPPLLSSNTVLVSPSSVLDSIKKVHAVDSLVSIQLIDILGNPFYQVRCVSTMHDHSTGKHNSELINHLADAKTGQLRGPLTEKEAVAVAARHFSCDPVLEKVEYLTDAHAHHEYRENPLPAFAVKFKHSSQTVVYVAAELGTVQKFRNEKWRVFDFLWMLHTMDYEGRDNFGNLALRIFSIFGLITVISGFALFLISAKWKKQY